MYRLVEQGKVRTPSPPTSPFEQTFDKISFRSNSGPRHQYFLLDGYSRGHHLHYDGNAIIRFTDRGRIWLHDSDYIRAMPKYHNSVTIVRDGQSMHIPPVCGLDLVADFTKVGLTRTCVRGYNGMDWLRNILWAKDELLLVIDDLVAKQPAHYALQCYWRTLGDAKVDGHRLETVQTERPLVSKVSLRDASGEAAIRYDAQDAHLVFSAKLGDGEHELQVRAYGPNTAADSFHIDLDGKRVLTLGIGIGKFSTTSGVFKVEKSGVHQLRVYLRESPGAHLDWIRLTPANGEGTTIEAESTNPPAPQPPKHFFITDLAGCRLKLKNDEETGRKYWRWYPYAEPVVRILHQAASVQLDAGEKHSFISLLQTTETANDPPFAGTRVAEGAVLISRAPDQGFVLAGVNGLKGDGNALRTDATSYAVSPTHVALGLGRSLDAGGHRWLSASEPIHLELDLEAGAGVAYVGEGVQIALDVPGIGAVHMGESGAGRRVFAFPPRPQRAIRDLTQCPAELAKAPPWEKRGKRDLLAAETDGLTECWSADAVSPVLSLAAADLDGDGADDVVAGTHAGEVRAFSSKGRSLWQFATGGQVRSVAACDLEGDGRPEIVVGSDDSSVYALSADGQKIWAFACPKYRREGRVVTVFPADLDGDGKHEVIAGAENWHYFALDRKGRELWRFESVHGSTVGTAADLDADGKQEVVMGTEYYWWRVVRPKGKLMFGVSHGPHCTAVWAGDLDGDGRGEVVFGCADSKLYMHVPEKRHHTVWEQSLGEEVTDLLAVPGSAEGQKMLIAGAESFNVFGVDPAGQIVWRRPFGDVPRCLCKGDFDGNGKIEIGVGCEDGSVSLLSSGGSLVASAVTDGSPADVVTLGARGRSPWLAAGTDRGRIQAFSAKEVQ